jgi:hypothetical protein
VPMPRDGRVGRDQQLFQVALVQQIAFDLQD